MSEPSPEAALWDALRGGLVTRALALVVELDIARLLEEGPRPAAGLAAATGADPDTLHRLLRALASDGIFAEEGVGVFRNTPASQLLTVDGWDDFARGFGGHWLQAVAGLDVSGQPSFPRVHGDEFWSWLGARPAERASFDRAMAQGWRGRLDRLDSVGWRGDETVVDVGGGNGSLLRALLERHPAMCGVVFDLPSTARDEEAFGERLAFVEGSFFDEVPPGDVHVLSTIVHNWDDDPALSLLRTVRASAGERLVLLESVIEPGNEPSGAKWLDLLMLVISGGRERTEEEWRALLKESGWETVQFHERGVIEARPA